MSRRLNLLSPAACRGTVICTAAMLIASGCANVGSLPQEELAALAAPVEVQECAAWFTAFDGIVDRAGVGDAEVRRIPGFPYLRVNRFLASFRQQAQSNPLAFAAWQDRLRELDARTRGYELANLPAASLPALGSGGRPDIAAHADRCASLLAGFDGAAPRRKAELTQLAQVPDDYADWKRAAGLYPLVKLPFFEFAKGWQTEASEMFRKAAAGDVEHEKVHRYRPTAAGVSAATISRMFANFRMDSLGIPQIGDQEATTLLAAYAPVYEIVTTGNYDLFGTLRWGGGPAPEVDTAHPTVYGRIAYTRHGSGTLVQLVYLIWFPERPDSSWLDVLSGRLDGLIFRVTLGPTGRPLVYDSIHACGCYHMFFPTPSVKPIPPPETRVEWAFIPRTLPAIEAPQRVVLRLTSRSHYLTDVQPDSGETSAGSTYAIIDDGILRTLPVAGGTRSAFASNGIVPGTQRGERMFVWPLGIEDAGAMREWGRHATALVGRRHFDDADLIERRFEILPSSSMVPSRRPRDG